MKNKSLLYLTSAFMLAGSLYSSVQAGHLDDAVRKRQYPTAHTHIEGASQGDLKTAHDILKGRPVNPTTTALKEAIETKAPNLKTPAAAAAAAAVDHLATLQQTLEALKAEKEQLAADKEQLTADKKHLEGQNTGALEELRLKTAEAEASKAEAAREKAEKETAQAEADKNRQDKEEAEQAAQDAGAEADASAAQVEDLQKQIEALGAR